MCMKEQGGARGVLGTCASQGGLTWVVLERCGLVVSLRGCARLHGDVRSALTQRNIFSGFTTDCVSLSSLGVPLSRIGEQPLRR